MNEKLYQFLKDFVDNFEPCDTCGGDGIDLIGDACHVCGATGVQVKSYGVLFSELLPEAKKLLEQVQS